MLLTRRCFQAYLTSRWKDVSVACSRQDTQLVISEIIKYLRETAQTCVTLARACPHRASALGLEEIAADLMAKAKELEELKLE